MGDVLANLTGSSIGLWASHYLERYYRHRREIERLYRPLAASPASSDEEDETTSPFLATTRRPLKSVPTQGEQREGQIRLGNVWDESLSREEIFGIGDDEDENLVSPNPRLSPKPTSPAPHIIVTAP